MEASESNLQDTEICGYIISINDENNIGDEIDDDYIFDHNSSEIKFYPIIELPDEFDDDESPTIIKIIKNKTVNQIEITDHVSDDQDDLYKICKCYLFIVTRDYEINNVYAGAGAEVNIYLKYVNNNNTFTFEKIVNINLTSLDAVETPADARALELKQAQALKQTQTLALRQAEALRHAQAQARAQARALEQALEQAKIDKQAQTQEQALTQELKQTLEKALEDKQALERARAEAEARAAAAEARAVVEAQLVEAQLARAVEAQLARVAVEAQLAKAQYPCLQKRELNNILNIAKLIVDNMKNEHLNLEPEEEEEDD